MMSVNFSQSRMNPELYAQQYATQNGITVEEAREQLKAQHGEPQQKAQETSLFKTNEDSYTSYETFTDFSDIELEDSSVLSDILNSFLGLFSSFGFKEDSQMQQPMDPDEYAYQYAMENDLTLEEAKEELKEKYGEPSKTMNPFLA